MRKALTTLLALLLLSSAAFSDTYRVTYTSHGLIQRITVQAESSAEARRMVTAIIPGALVTGAHRVGR